MKQWRIALLWIVLVILAAVTRLPAAAAPAEATSVATIAEAYTAYIVQAGDSLTRIAARYGISASQLAAANGKSAGSWLYAGETLVIPDSTSSSPVAVPSGITYVVQRGDTLMNVAARYGVTVSQLAAMNGLYWNSWVYVGQQLTIPGGQTTSEPTTSTPTTGTTTESQTYVVQLGNTLFSIARTHGTTVTALRAANGLTSDTIYVGQRLVIPGSGATTTQPVTQPTVPDTSAYGEKWIDINLSQQRITAYQGQTPIYSAIVSTGLPGTPTVVGTFSIYVKYRYTPMSGPGYYLPNVPHTMYFYLGYAIHGAYWHTNFGSPASHGCVNLSLGDAEWFYNWAPVGTTVVSHY